MKQPTDGDMQHLLICIYIHQAHKHTLTQDFWRHRRTHDIVNVREIQATRLWLSARHEVRRESLGGACPTSDTACPLGGPRAPSD